MNYELFRIYGIYDEVPIFNGNNFGLEIISKKLILPCFISKNNFKAIQNKNILPKIR